MSKAIDFGFDDGETWDEFYKRLTSGESRPNLSNGRPVNYSEAARSQHRNHIDAAVYDNGGWLQPGNTMAHNDSDEPEAVDPL